MITELTEFPHWLGSLFDIYYLYDGRAHRGDTDIALVQDTATSEKEAIELAGQQGDCCVYGYNKMDATLVQETFLGYYSEQTGWLFPDADGKVTLVPYGLPDWWYAFKDME